MSFLEEKEKIVLSQSKIKALLKKPEHRCPRQIKEIFFDRTFELQSDSMDKGIYFETQVLGSGAKGKSLDDLPRLKSGDKSTDQKRIDQQVEFFKGDFTKMYGIKVVEKYTQVVLEVDVSPSLSFRGEVDLITPIRDNGKTIKNALTDVKLTKDCNSTFGDFCWGAPHLMDHTQAFAYTWAFEQMYGMRLPFYYLIFDYSTKPDYKPIKKSVSDDDIEGFLHNMDLAYNVYRSMEDDGFVERAGAEQCRNCPIGKAGLCKSKSDKKEIQII